MPLPWPCPVPNYTHKQEVIFSCLKLAKLCFHFPQVLYKHGEEFVKLLLHSEWVKSLCFGGVSNVLHLCVCHNFASISIWMHGSVKLVCLFFGSLCWLHGIAVVVKKAFIKDVYVKFSFRIW